MMLTTVIDVEDGNGLPLVLNDGKELSPMLNGVNHWQRC
jgi:hypothetical protein